MFDKSKTDPVLGMQVYEHLLGLGLETPMDLEAVRGDAQTKIDAIEEHMKSVMDILGLDRTNDSLTETPRRIAKMYVKELFWGMDPENFPKATTVSNDGIQYDEMVTERKIRVMSVCEHHFVTIDGFACVSYIPKDNVIGLSKINRIVEYYARRPQVQERMTAQIHAALCFLLKTDDVAIQIEAAHYCVKSRGIEDQNSSTATTKMSGCFRDPSNKAREEFLATARCASLRG
jgi:GTP cyclohydrolase I